MKLKYKSHVQLRVNLSEVTLLCCARDFPSCQVSAQDSVKEGEKGEDLWVELSDEERCNWAMFVRPAQNHLEQNLVAYQYGRDIYYTTIKNIEPKQELKVPARYTAATRFCFIHENVCVWSFLFSMPLVSSGVVRCLLR